MRSPEDVICGGFLLLVSMSSGMLAAEDYGFSKLFQLEILSPEDSIS